MQGLSEVPKQLGNMLGAEDVGVSKLFPGFCFQHESFLQKNPILLYLIPLLCETPVGNPKKHTCRGFHLL